MISHEHKCIFIHIPKTAGTSIYSFFYPGVEFHYENPDYERLFGWCPERKIHMQHATSKQLLETGLISEEQWKEYFKFTFVRNPWDRAFSDYFWIMRDRKIAGSFKDYITKAGNFEKILSKGNKEYRGDHLDLQTSFFSFTGENAIDYTGRFENLVEDFQKIKMKLGIGKPLDIHLQRNYKEFNHYSLFYTRSRKKLVDKFFALDIQLLQYEFEEKKVGIELLKNLI